MLYTESLAKLVAELKRMPGIGNKSAERLALYILGLPKDEAGKLAQAILQLKERIFYCSRCGNITEVDPCTICQSPARDAGILCVVEWPNDLLAIEKTRGFRGHYHVLMGAISPKTNIGPEALRIKELQARVSSQQVREIILATSPTLEGEATAMYLYEVLKPLGRITHGGRIGVCR